MTAPDSSSTPPTHIAGYRVERVLAVTAMGTVYLVQIGYISMQADETRGERMARVARYVTVFTGRKPKQRELDRFFARHGFVPETVTS